MGRVETCSCFAKGSRFSKTVYLANGIAQKYFQSQRNRSVGCTFFCFVAAGVYKLYLANYSRRVANEWNAKLRRVFVVKFHDHTRSENLEPCLNVTIYELIHQVSLNQKLRFFRQTRQKFVFR